MTWAFKWYDFFALATELAGNVGGIFNDMPLKRVKMTKEEFETTIQREITEGKTTLTVRHIGELVSPIYFVHRFNGKQNLTEFAKYVEYFDGPKFDYSKYVEIEKSTEESP
jgi:hypothetical protein